MGISNALLEFLIDNFITHRYFEHKVRQEILNRYTQMSKVLCGLSRVLHKIHSANGFLPEASYSSSESLLKGLLAASLTPLFISELLLELVLNET